MAPIIDAVPSASLRHLVVALDQAIPEDEWRELLERVVESGIYPPTMYIENGGFFRGSISPDLRVASYNNTRKNEQEVIEWFERAILLL